MIEIGIPTPSDEAIKINVDVVAPDIQLSIGLDVLDREKLVATNVSNELQSTTSGWSMPLTRNLGHMYLCWNMKHTVYEMSY